MGYKEAKNNQSEQQEEKPNPPNEDSISSHWDNFKRSNICIIGVPEGEEKEQEIGNLFENISMQVQGAQIVGNKMDAKRPTPRHIIIEMPKIQGKERILKVADKRN